MGNNNTFLSVNSKSFEITGSASGTDIEIYDCTINDVIEHFGTGNILEEIGLDEVKKHFGIE